MITPDAPPRVVRCFVAILAVAVVCPSADAFLTINLIYTGNAASEPSYDPGGTQLMAMMNAAAEHWGRSTGIIQDNHTITIQISWANLSDPNNTLGQHTNLDGGPVPKPTLAQIQMDTQLNGVNRNWYFDPTPTDHTEFNLAQTRYGSLSAANQAAWFNGSPPPVLETGFAGGATATAPVAAQTGPDMLSVAIHELGHALGMTTNVASFQTSDGDYDVNPGFVGGFTMGITDDGTFHLPQTNTVMAPNINAGIRRLASATDVFSIASASGWTDLLLDRVDYIGGSVFNDPASWIGGKTPNAATDAFVRSFGSGGITVAQTSMQFQNLSVFDAWNVTALQNNVLLDVQDTTTIDGTNTTAGTTKIVLQGGSSPGSLLDTQDLFIANGGRLELDGQIPFAAAKAQQTIDIDPQSSIFGHGFVSIVNDVVTDVLNNRGLIEADGGELRLAATNTVNPVFDLDGDDPSNVGNLRAVTGDLSVFGLHVGEFAGEIEVGAGHEASFEHRFVVNVAGNVLLFSNLIEPATISGADLVVRGDIVADKIGRVGNGSSDLVTFEGPAVAGGAARVIVDQSNDELRLEGPAVFHGGQYVGAGAIRQHEDITIASDTQIDVGTYDWGNSPPLVSNDTLIETDATFTVNSPTTGTPDNEYRGVIRVKNGALEVNTASGWALPPEETVAGVPRTPKGTLILEDRKSGSDMPRVRGQHITLGGLLLSTGGPGAVESDLTTEPTAEINVLAQAELLLQGATTYNGGNIHGQGTLRQIGHANVIGNTTIATTHTDWDGDELSPSNTTILPGVLFQINSNQIDDSPTTDGYDGTVTITDTAALVVFTSGPSWTLDGTMALQGQQVAVPQAIVDGVTLLNKGRIEGNGWFQMPVINDDTIAPGQSAGTIRFEQDLTLSGGAITEIQIGGLTKISEFDVIDIGGLGNLAGTLQLSMLGGFVPFQDHEFDILTAAGGVFGTFSNVLFPTLPGIALCLRYDANTVTVTAGLIGDLNGDGFVGIADLNIVRGNWNYNTAAGVWAGGDPSGDGFVGIADLNAVLGNWNAGTPPGDTANIPEPGSVFIALSGLILLAGSRYARYS